MSSPSTQYAVLQDNEPEDAAIQDDEQADAAEYFNTQVGDALVTMDDLADPRQDGWDDDFDVEDDDDPDDTERLGEDEDCRRKVSQGRPSASPTFAFSSTSVVHRHGAGRGGGLRPMAVQVDRLSTILEGTPIGDEEQPNGQERGNVIAVTFPRDGNPSHDLSRLLEGTVPPEPDPKEKQITMFTFRAQLTWGLDKGPQVNLPELFRDWVKHTNKYIPDFALVPFEDDKGQVISTPEQVPNDNPTFYKEYYHNHRVLQHGNLTGMVQF